MSKCNDANNHKCHQYFNNMTLEGSSNYSQDCLESANIFTLSVTKIKHTGFN